MLLTHSDEIRNLNKKEKEYLKEMCRYSNNLYNSALYNARQRFIAGEGYISKFDNINLMKENENYKLLQAGSAGYTILDVDGAMQSFKALKNDKKTFAKARLPYYREKGGLFPITVGGVSISIRNGYFRVPMSRSFKKLHPDCEIKIPVPKRMEGKKIHTVKIVPVFQGEYFKIQYSYESEDEIEDVDKNNVMGIDIGVGNLASCVTTLGDSFIMDGKCIKSTNYTWNNRMAKLQSIGDRQGVKSTHQMQRITRKRNNQTYDTMMKTARYIVNYCIDHQIGTIVLGYNQGMKDGIKQRKQMNKKNRRVFVQVPYTKLRNQLKCLCDRYGITYIEHEEAYTSKSSFLDNDPILQYGEKGDIKFSGRRVKRGMYRSSDGTEINADINAAANILRKTIPEYDRENLKKAVLKTPERIRVQ